MTRAPARHVFCVFFLGVLLQLLLLIVWTAVDPFQRIVVSVSDLDITTTQQCSCSVPWVWLLEIALFSVVLLWGVVATYSTWQLKEEVGESKWNLILVYNVIVVVSVSIPVIVTLSPSEEAVALVAGFCTWAAASSTSLFVLMPHLLRWRNPTEADLRMAKRKSTRTASASIHSQDADTADSPPSSQAEKEPQELAEMHRLQERAERKKKLCEQLDAEDNAAVARRFLRQSTAGPRLQRAPFRAKPDAAAETAEPAQLSPSSSPPPPPPPPLEDHTEGLLDL